MGQRWQLKLCWRLKRYLIEHLCCIFATLNCRFFELAVLTGWAAHSATSMSRQSTSAMRSWLWGEVVAPPLWISSPRKLSHMPGEEDPIAAVGNLISAPVCYARCKYLNLNYKNLLQFYIALHSVPKCDVESLVRIQSVDWKWIFQLFISFSDILENQIEIWRDFGHCWKNYLFHSLHFSCLRSSVPLTCRKWQNPLLQRLSPQAPGLVSMSALSEVLRMALRILNRMRFWQTLVLIL